MLLSLFASGPAPRPHLLAGRRARVRAYSLRRPWQPLEQSSTGRGRGGRPAPGGWLVLPTHMARSQCRLPAEP